MENIQKLDAMDLTPSEEDELLKDSESIVKNVQNAANDFAAKWTNNILKPSALGAVLQHVTNAQTIAEVIKLGADAAESIDTKDANAANPNEHDKNDIDINTDAKLCIGIPDTVAAHLITDGQTKSPPENLQKTRQPIINEGASSSRDGNSEQKVANEGKNDDDLKPKGRVRGGRRVREKNERKARAAESAAKMLNENKSDTNKPPINVASRQMQQMDKKSTPKRSHVKGETPPDVTHVNKKGKASDGANKQTLISKQTLAKAVSDANLVMAVVDSPAEGVIVPLTKDKYDGLKKAIDAFVFKCIDTNMGSALPSFEVNQFTRGVMKVRCATPATKTWLSNAIVFLPKIWAGMTLKTMNFDDLPEPKKVLGLFRSCDLENDKILHYLAAQNPRLNVACWSTVSSSKSGAGLHIVFSMPEDQFEALKNLNFKLFFGSGTAMFRDISKKQRGETEPNADAMDIEEENKDDENDVTIVPGNNITSSTASADTPKTGKANAEQ